MSQAEWYYAQNGILCGPMTLETLSALVAAEQVRLHDLVWRIGLSEWQPASRLDEMANAAVPVDGPTTPPPLPTERKVVPPPLPSERKEPKRRRRERPETHDPPKSKTPIILAIVSGSFFFLCLGCCGISSFFSSRDAAERRAREETRAKEATEKAQKELAAADESWTSGKKNEAIGKYRALVDDPHIPEADRGRVYSRLIDFEYESGNPKAGGELIEAADKKGIGLQVAHADAKRAVDTFQSEKKRLAAEQAERERVAAAKKAEEDRKARRTPVEWLREAQPNELIDAVRMCNDFIENEVAANENYKDKVWMLTGIVYGVESGDILSSHRIRLSDSRGNVVANCYLSKEAAKSTELRDLKRGAFVRVYGTCRGKDGILSQIKMQDCQFIIIKY